MNLISTSLVLVSSLFASGVANAALSIETLHSMHLNGNELQLSVTSHGCSKPEHFQLLVQQAITPELSLIRTKPDTCGEAPGLMQLTFQLEMLDIDANNAFRLLNNFQQFKGVRRISSGPSEEL